jgi:leucyl-tRNA synthetase
MDYNPRQIEKKWRIHWSKNNIYKISNDAELPKYYVLDMFPYPSGAGLHVGHPLGYIASDIFSRFKRMNGFNVLHPMGYDAFGLPAEQYAIQTGVHPAISTEQNIARYRNQLDNLGFSYDWSREVRTCDPQYYKWTQWIFLQLFHHYYDNELGRARPIEDLVKQFELNGNKEFGFTSSDWHEMTALQKDELLMNFRLAYRKITFVNWCEDLGTVLANDEVKDGKSERGGYPVERKPMLQWSLRITAYAERLLDDLEDLEWSDAMKKMQANWIGKSQGAQLFFQLENRDIQLEIYTTRPDTIFGATFMVIAPEHDLVPDLTTEANRQQVDHYIDYVKSRSERDRMAEVKEVTGAFTGSYAINPFDGNKIPIWISEYVLKDYGTGAIMAVPADDERDLRFAEKFALPIIPIIDKSKYPGAGLEDKVGIMINSGFLDGMEVPDAIELAIQKIEELGIGKRKTNYKLRDAIYSRQRYWGEPFPVKYDQDGVTFPLTPDELPLELPQLEDFKPASGNQSPLARATEWVHTPDGMIRETDTMPGFAGSSWYFLRYMDPLNQEEFAAKKALDYWKDVDLYIGGTEHAVGHLMYSRFWHKFLFDKGLVPTKEPFKKLINQGMIGGTMLFAQKATIADINHQLQEIWVSAHIKVGDTIKLMDDSQWTVNALNKRLIPLALGKELGGQWRLYHTALENAEKIDPAGWAYLKGFMDTKDHFNWDIDDRGNRYISLPFEIGKMSKSKYNVINPDDIVEEYGADCFRMYEMFLGPVEQAKPWDTKGIDGVSKFLKRFWGLYFDQQGKFSWTDQNPTKEDLKTLHATIKKVSEDIDRFAFNTCVSSFMIAVNDFKKSGTNSKSILEPLLRLLAPFAPHITEELWHIAGHNSSIHLSIYPKYESSYLIKDNFTYPVSINGKKRGTIDFPADAPKEDIERMVLNMEIVQKWTEGKEVSKIIVVPGRMINVVLNQ